jgi:hypothetical protein
LRRSFFSRNFFRHRRRTLIVINGLQRAIYKRFLFSTNLITNARALYPWSAFAILRFIYGLALSIDFAVRFPFPLFLFFNRSLVRIMLSPLEHRKNLPRRETTHCDYDVTEWEEVFAWRSAYVYVNSFALCR